MVLTAQIRNIYSREEVKPRMFDVMIDDDGMVYVCTKHGARRDVILWEDFVRQLITQLPGFNLGCLFSKQ